MKKTLLFTKKAKLALTLLVFCLCLNYGFSQTNLVQNGTAEDHGTGIPASDTSDTDDNADSFDLTPNSTLNGGITSPYRYDADDNPTGWRNDDLDSWLNDNCGDSNEQPSSSSDGNWDYVVTNAKTRGWKIRQCRRLYQLVHVTQGVEYTFSIDTRAEAENVPAEVYMLNKEIAGEDELIVANYDHFENIATHYNSSKPSASTPTFTTTTFTFTASTDKVVIYVRPVNSPSSSEEIFVDNIMLYDASTASIENNEFSRSFNVYPNPASGTLFIRSNEYEVSNVAIFNVMGQKVLEKDSVNKNQLDISGITKGIYILKVSSDSKSFSKKIIIE